MRKVKFLVASLLFCAMSYVGYTTYEEMSMTEAEKLMQANVEALTQSEPGGSEIDCPNGGYLSKGNRSESIETWWEKIDINTGLSLGLFKKEGSVEFGIRWQRVITVAYNCDASNQNVCLVCNRYRI